MVKICAINIFIARNNIDSLADIHELNHRTLCSGCFPHVFIIVMTSVHF